MSRAWPRASRSWRSTANKPCPRLVAMGLCAFSEDDVLVRESRLEVDGAYLAGGCATGHELAGAELIELVASSTSGSHGTCGSSALRRTDSMAQ